MEKCGKIGRFSGQIRPDWESTTQVATTRLGSKGLKTDLPRCPLLFTQFDTPSLMHIKSNYLAFSMYLDDPYRLNNTDS